MYQFKPLYEDTDSFNRQEFEKQNQRWLKTMLNSAYGSMVKENNMRIKDFIVLHADNQPIIIKKDAITTLSRLADGTVRIETTNQIWITDDKYEDVIKRLFEV